MHIVDDALREVVVDDGAHAAEVHATPHQLRGDEEPNVTATKRLHDLFALGFRAVRVDHIHADVVVHKLLVELLGTCYALHKDEHGRPDPALNELPHSKDLALFLAHKQKLLLD
eukprot:Amastigsp_a3769_42.p3 type:complete len:114 gc:universal Amastigsp_a3769_42:303-644(+)